MVSRDGAKGHGRNSSGRGGSYRVEAAVAEERRSQALEAFALKRHDPGAGW